MNHDHVEIKILTEDLAPVVPENPPTPTMQERATDAAQQAREQAADVAQKVWQSETRKRVTQSVGHGAKKVVKKGGQAVTNVMVKTAERQARERATAMQQRLQETDWKQASKEGAATGLRWLSQKLSNLATKFKPSDEDVS